MGTDSCMDEAVMGLAILDVQLAFSVYIFYHISFINRDSVNYTENVVQRALND